MADFVLGTSLVCEDIASLLMPNRLAFPPVEYLARHQSQPCREMMKPLAQARRPVQPGVFAHRGSCLGRFAGFRAR